MTIRCLVMLLLLIPVIYADEGRTFELDFNAKDSYELWLRKSDRVLFQYGGYNNTIIIDEIKNQSVELDIFLFLEEGLHTPDYQFLSKKYELRLDFDKDRNKEMGINLISIDNKKEAANLLFRKLEDWDPNAVLNLPEWKTADEKNTGFNYLYLSAGAVLALFLLISLMLFWIYNNKKKGMYF